MEYEFLSLFKDHGNETQLGVRKFWDSMGRRCGGWLVDRLGNLLFG